MDQSVDRAPNLAPQITLSGFCTIRWFSDDLFTSSQWARKNFTNSQWCSTNTTESEKFEVLCVPCLREKWAFEMITAISEYASFWAEITSWMKKNFPIQIKTSTLIDHYLTIAYINAIRISMSFLIVSHHRYESLDRWIRGSHFRPWWQEIK